jgi:hypothetical protein
MEMIEGDWRCEEFWEMVWRWGKDLEMGKRFGDGEKIWRWGLGGRLRKKSSDEQMEGGTLARDGSQAVKRSPGSRLYDGFGEPLATNL